MGTKNLLQALRLSSQVCRSSSRITSARTPTHVPTSISVVVLPSRVQLTSRSSSSTGAIVDVDYIYDMDMNTIESVTVLKDASASALYGC